MPAHLSCSPGITGKTWKLWWVPYYYQYYYYYYCYWYFTWLYFYYVFVQLTCCFAVVLKTAKALDFVTFLWVRIIKILIYRASTTTDESYKSKKKRSFSHWRWVIIKKCKGWPKSQVRPADFRYPTIMIPMSFILLPDRKLICCTFWMKTLSIFILKCTSHGGMYGPH